MSKKEHIYEDLKEFRTDRGMSQKKLAQELGISQPLVSSVENGRREVTPELKQAFHTAFGHFGYKVKGINDLMGPVEREVPDSKNSQVIIEKMKEEEKDRKGWKSKDARPAVKPKRKPWVDEAVQEANGKVAKEAAKEIAEEAKQMAEEMSQAADGEKEETFDKVYLVISDGDTRGFKAKEGAAVFAWDLAIEGVVYRVDEVEVE